MPRALLLSIPARTDLDRIYDRISRVNPAAADQLIEDLARSFRTLTEHTNLAVCSAKAAVARCDSCHTMTI
jgi:plasmid stabilization system protein ParE